MSELKEMNDEEIFDKEEDTNDKEEEPIDEEYSDKEEETGTDADDAESDNLDSDVDYDSEMEGEEGGEGEGGEGEGGGVNKNRKTGGAKKGTSTGEAEGADTSDTDDGSDDDDDDYLQKFNQSMRDDLILNFHPESKSHNYEEIKQLAKVTRNKNGIVVDELHKTIPLLTKYEKTRILGQRAKQIETGATPLVQVPPNIIDSYLIAKLELAQNTIPFIIRRPLPNGGMEYWHVSDLENV